jgi:hypothetical protein
MVYATRSTLGCVCSVCVSGNRKVLTRPLAELCQRPFAVTARLKLPVAPWCLFTVPLSYFHLGYDEPVVRLQLTIYKHR